MVITVIATARLSTLRHSALMAASSQSTVDTSSKTPRTAATLVATAMKSEPRLTRVTLEATSSALSDMSTTAQLRATAVVVMMMTVATVVVVTTKAAMVAAAATADRRRAAMAETVVTVAKRAATVATAAMDVKRRAATAAKSKAAMVEVTEEAMNAATRAAMVVAVVVTSVVKRADMAAVVAMSVERRAAVTAAVRRVDTEVITTDAETKVALAEALLMSIFARAREAMDVSVVAATNTAIMAMVVTDVGKLLSNCDGKTLRTVHLHA
jgi:hypothetical protein